MSSSSDNGSGSAAHGERTGKKQRLENEDKTVIQPSDAKVEGPFAKSIRIAFGVFGLKVCEVLPKFSGDLIKLILEWAGSYPRATCILKVHGDQFAFSIDRCPSLGTPLDYQWHPVNRDLPMQLIVTDPLPLFGLEFASYDEADVALHAWCREQRKAQGKEELRKEIGVTSTWVGRHYGGTAVSIRRVGPSPTEVLIKNSFAVTVDRSMIV